MPIAVGVVPLQGTQIGGLEEPDILLVAGGEPAVSGWASVTFPSRQYSRQDLDKTKHFLGQKVGCICDLLLEFLYSYFLTSSFESDRPFRLIWLLRLQGLGCCPYSLRFSRPTVFEARSRQDSQLSKLKLWVGL